MQCPFCGSSEHKVVDKRTTPDKMATRRRRMCLKCEKRFTSYERIEIGNKVVVKKDGKKKEPFSRQKLAHGVSVAFWKRPFDEEQVNSVIDQVELEVRNMEESEIPSNRIGNIVMDKLKEMDKIAYIRFASVYREFKDIQEFQKELTKLKKGR